MPPSKTPFVTGCQQILALGVVLAALAPAASVVSLDVVRGPRRPGGAPRPSDRAVELSAYTREASASPPRCPTAPVDPRSTEYSLTAGRRARPVAAPAPPRRARQGRLRRRAPR